MITRRTLLASAGTMVLAGGTLLSGDSSSHAGTVRLPPPSGGDDTASLNAALRAGAGGLVQGPHGARYQVSAPLVVHSGTVLLMSGCTVTLAAGSACSLLINKAATAGGRDRDITVLGGTWVRAEGVGGVGPDLHTLRWRRVDGLTLNGLAVETASDKYAISLGDVTDTTVTRIRFAVHSDGVHIQGPAARTRISGIRGSTGDDTVAITPRDWQAYDDVWGPVTDTVIEDVSAASLAALVKVLGGSPETVASRTTVRGVTGLAGTSVLWIGDDTADWRTTGGRVDELVVERVSAATLPGRGGVVRIDGSSVGRVHLRGLTVDGPGANRPLVHVAPSTPTAVDALTVEDVDVTRLGTASLLSIDAKATVRSLRVERLTVGGTSSGARAIRIAGAVDDLTLRTITVAATGDSHLLELPEWAAKATVRQATLSGVRGVGNGGGLVTAPAATHTLPRLVVDDVQTTGMVWLADLNTETELLLSKVTIDDSTGGFAKVRGSGAVVVRGDGLRSAPGSRGVAVTSGGSVVSYAPDLAVDVSELVRVDGSRATNTNARLPCGTGPVVCTGLTWQHLQTGATY
ncbi:hypothetical protein [Micromonospora narathiwatensis]|uniref:Right handed beta helix region n=1 Tax=Micromonospora narathiwatensis TaxID=299146 RepID=A0A1A9AGA7_9ACTN|nr:hypothetical protein [Micromonospora narathiwatensis]SBT55142.1 hypothetical protein GA0070621_5920 [Micromonospora narathiwatensis]